MNIGRQFVVATLALTATVAGFAQTSKRPAFEVASIRAGAPGTRMAQRVTQGRVEIVNTPLRSVLMMAFRVEASRISGPDWLNNVRFDIQAAIPAGGSREQVPEMLQTLLAARFGLVAHVEPRPLDAYELVVGKTGIRMREIESVDELNKVFAPDPSIKGSNLDMTSDTLDGPVRTMMIPLGLRHVTTRSLYDTWTTAQRTFQVDATRITMAEFAGILTANVDRPVIDKTGLTGVYGFKVELDANASVMRLARSVGLTTTVNGNPIDEPTGVSTFKAVEGLGLKLEERRLPFDFVIIDRIERTPTEN